MVFSLDGLIFLLRPMRHCRISIVEAAPGPVNQF